MTITSQEMMIIDGLLCVILSVLLCIVAVNEVQDLFWRVVKPVYFLLCFLVYTMNISPDYSLKSRSSGCSRTP